VSVDRRLHLWTLMVEQANGTPVAVDHAGAVAVAVAEVDTVAVVVTLAASPRENVYASSSLGGDLEELTTTVGEGPGVDALRDGPALAADLREAWCLDRWPIFAPAAVELGVCAAFALPLQVGGIRLGVMDLYRVQPGVLDHDHLADALLLADTACALLLDGPGLIAGRRPEEASLQHPEVHQATGMIVAQLGVSAAVALVRLRAYAYSHEERLRDVAARVVARRIRFHTEPAAGGVSDDDEGD
jgi:ANTAR domain-containing protein